VGDRFVMEKMKKHGAILGGEGSGHMICLSKTTTGDGIISSLQVLEVLIKNQVSLADLKLGMAKYPQVLINVKTKNKVDIDNHQTLNTMIKKIESELGDDGRVLVRTSGTEPLIRVMVEAKDKIIAQQSAEKLAGVFR
jgi:phosphoglucosamine mutase